jgi:hypothetical protein
VQAEQIERRPAELQSDLFPLIGERTSAGVQPPVWGIAGRRWRVGKLGEAGSQIASRGGSGLSQRPERVLMDAGNPRACSLLRRFSANLEPAASG